MKVRTKFVLTIMTVMLLGVGLTVGWLYYSSSRSVMHQAEASNSVFSGVLTQAVDVIMRSGQQSQLDDYLERVRKSGTVAEIRVIRSGELEKELGVKESSHPRDALDLQALSSGKEAVSEVMVGSAKAIRTVTPFVADKTCLACHTGSREGETIAALSSTYVFQATIDEMVRGLVKNGLINILIILLVTGIIFWFFNLFIMKPLVRIGAAAQKFGKGDWAAVTGLMPGDKEKRRGELDEINGLSASLQEMALDLQKMTVSRDELVREMDERKRIDAALQESQQRFNQLAEQSGMVVWELDTRGLFTYVSHVSEAVFGYYPGDLEGRKFAYELYPEEGREEFRQTVAAILERQEAFVGLVHLVQKKDGRQIWVSTDGIPLLNADGSLRGFRGSSTDITQKREKEEKERKQLRELEIFFKASLGREERIIGLKKELEKLRKEIEGRNV